MMIGLYAMIAKNNLVKKLIGMSIFQTAIILFYVSIGVEGRRDIPIMPRAARRASCAQEGIRGIPNQSGYANPLPHVLMLTAIVVGVATLGMALAICQTIYKDFGTLEEDEILAEQGGPGRDG